MRTPAKALKDNPHLRIAGAEFHDAFLAFIKSEPSVRTACLEAILDQKGPNAGLAEDKPDMTRC